MLTFLMLLSSTLAGAPERQVATFDVGTSSMTGGATTTSGQVVSFVGGGQAVLVDVERWSAVALSPCSVTAAAPDLSGAHLWVGCDDGSLHLFDIVAGVPSAAVNDDGVPVVIQAFDLGVLALHVAGTVNERVYAIGENEGETTAQVDIYDAASTAFVSSTPLPLTGFSASAVDLQRLYVAHRDGFISTMILTGGAPILTNNPIPITIDDLLPTRRNSALALQRGSSGQVAEYSPSSLSYLQLFPSEAGLQGAGLLAENDGGYLLMAFGDRIEVHTATAAVIETEVASTIAVDATLRDLVPLASGYTLAGSNDGRVVVLSDRPWVDVALPAPSVVDGEMLVVEFITDVAGTYSIDLDGTLATPGTQVAAGDALVGDNRVEVLVDGWSEGKHDLFVRVRDGRGRSGHDWASATVDGAPDTVRPVVDFTDGALQVSFAAFPDTSSIEVYTVYLSDQPFTGAEYPTGGPSYVEGDFEAPIDVLAVDAVDGVVTVRLEPLTNDKTYYIGVRATDTTQQEGAMSEVVEGRPRLAQNASQRSGETGGLDCNTTGGGVVGLGLLGLLGAALVRRRRTGLMAGLFVVAGLSVAADAQASIDEDGDGIDDRTVYDPEDDKGDATPAWANMQLRYGAVAFTDEDMKAVYGNTGGIFVEGGAQIYRFLELNLGGGLVREADRAVDQAGVDGLPLTRLTLVPLTASANLRLHIVDEQVFVPYGSFGGDAWAWREAYDDGTDSAKDVTTGIKLGYHLAAGGQILLDPFGRKRASLLEAQSGINDTWLVLEFRRQFIDGDGEMAFSGDVFSAGLKFDF